MAKKKIFISHISDEANLAHEIQKRIESDFLGLVDVFVSSDTESIAAGSNWLQSIETALKTCKVLLVLCSPASVGRPWINFEAGVAWARQIPIVPLCHSGLEPKNLPMPLSILQATNGTDAEGVKRVYKLVADTIACKVPHSGITDFVRAVHAFEEASTVTATATVPPTAPDEITPRDRMRALLAEPRFRFRSLDRLSVAGGVSEDEALAILRSDPDVVLARGKSGNRIARLKSR